ncbi:MAG: efflux RND transporter periplasmic adaptor subunit [Byssovorax sp.]
MSRSMYRLVIFTPLAFALALTPACQRPGGAAHEHDHAHEAEETPEPLAITKWTAGYELFVELTPPRPGKPVDYHAHVTRLDGFKAVTEGAFRVRFKTPAGVAAEAGIQGVKRPGIFVFEAPAPGAGSYTLEMTYEHDGASEVFDGGAVTVADPPAPAAERSGAATTFLKESQWKIPFATAWAEEHPLAKEIELAATVESAGTDQLTVGAPTGGRFFHNPKLALAEGGRIQKGDVLGWIAPTVAGDDYSRLVFAVDETRLTRTQTQREIARIEPLVQQSLLPEKRLIDLRNELDTLTTRLRSAEARLGRIASPGGDGVPIRSTIEGVIAQSLVANGAPVESGAPLVRIGGTAHLWIRARFAARAASSFADAVPVAARLPSGARVDLEKPGARFLSTLPTVDPSSGLATWIVDVAPPPIAAIAGRESDVAAAKSPADLRPGAAIVLSVRIGAPRTVLAVPRSAVVEINTRPFVFLQLDGEHFEKRGVVPGDADGGFIAVTSGVAAGERIVTTGGFDIHLASLMGTIESHRH